MPWTTKNPPSVAKNWPTAAQALCVRVGNAALKAGKSDQDAIYACIGAVKSAYPKVVGSSKKNSEFTLMFGEGAESALGATTKFFAVKTIELKEGTNGRKISEFQVLPEGKFLHPWYGELDFTAPVLRQVRKNFDARILGTDIMVDEGHDRGKALGWYKELHYGKKTIDEQEFAGLWGTVEWTELGEEYLSKDIYKYFSAEMGSWTKLDAEGKPGEKIPNVLLGGGLTNRPYFKQMPAVKLGEGEAADRFVIGLFVDEAWAFTAGTPEEEEDDEESEHVFNHSFLYSLGEEDDEEDEDEEEEEEESMDELIKEINAKYKKEFKTKEEVLAFLGTLHEGESGGDFSEKFRTTFGALGVEFTEGQDPIAAVAKAFQSHATTATALGTRVAAVELKLGESEFEQVFSSNLRAGKVVPAQKEKMKKLFTSDRQMFDELMEVQPTTGPVFSADSDIGSELGHAGGHEEPGQEGKFREGSDEAKKEAQRYVTLSGGTARRNGKAGLNGFHRNGAPQSGEE